MADSFAASGESVHLTFDEQTLKIVKIKKAGGRKAVGGVYVKEIVGLSPGDVAREILAGLAALKTKIRRVSLILPSKYVITKDIEVPSLDEEEIQSIVRLQAVRHTPYSREEVTVGHLNLEVLMERYTKALLVIGSNENIKKRTDVIAGAGCEVDAVHLSFEILAKATASYAAREYGTGPYGCVYLDTESTDFIAVVNYRPYFIRSIPIGARLLQADPTAGLRKLMEEFRKTWDACQAECQGAVFKNFMILGAKTAEQRLLCKNIEDEYKVSAKPVTLEDRLNILPEAHGGLENLGTRALLDVMMDGILEDEVFGLDLLPEDLRLKKSFRSKGREMFMMGIYMLAVFGLVVGIFLVQIYFRNHALGEMKQNYEAKQEEANKLIEISEETKFMRNFKQKRGVALKALDEFQKILPQQMYVSEISLSDEGKFTIKGTSELMSLVFSFVTEMENSPVFAGVASDYTKSRKEGEKDVSDFGITCTLEDNAHHGS